MSRLCLCLTASTVEGCLAQWRRYQSMVDMVEMRVDLMEPSNRRSAVEVADRIGGECPLILTVRLTEDGGAWGRAGEGYDERNRLLVDLLESRTWDFVDLEYEGPSMEVAAAAQRTNTRIIWSIHDFTGDLLDRSHAELTDLVRRLASGGGVAKLAVKCRGTKHLLKLARLGEATRDVESKVILGMGEYGTPSRILADRLASLWTYSSSTGGPGEPPAAAPGQLSPDILQKLYRFGSIGRDTSIYGVMGNPISHSRSPEIHNEWLGRIGLNGTYVPFRTDDTPAMLAIAKLWGIFGLSVTVPHKQKVLGLADERDELTQKIGAANTLVSDGAKWWAYNTDASGFLNTLMAALGAGPQDLKGLRALVIGAGGAARAAVHALADAGVKLVILNRSQEKARLLAEEVGGLWGSLSETSRNIVSGCIDFAVQTTSAGMPPLEGVDPIPWWNFEGVRLVYDMIYAPPVTPLIKRASQAGIPTVNGEGMLEAQGRLQFRYFTGLDAPQAEPGL